MSLNWNLEGIADYKNKCWRTDEATGESNLNPVTHSLIWLTMTVGIGEITEGNWVDFFSRVRLVEALHGTYLNGPNGEEVPMTPEDVFSHIGLHTNASSMTKTKFRKWFCDGAEHDAITDAERFLRDRKVA